MPGGGETRNPRSGRFVCLFAELQPEQPDLPPVGVSVGYAVSDPGGSERLESIITRADQRMYENKKERAMQQIASRSQV